MDLFAEISLVLLDILDEVFNVDDGEAVIFFEDLGDGGFSRDRWADDNDFIGFESSVLIELSDNKLDSFFETFRTVPFRDLLFVGDL